MKIRRIKTFEGGELILGRDGLLERDLETLDHFERTSRLGAFQVRLKSVKLNGYVGTFATSDLVLDILPKAEPQGTPDTEALFKKWSTAFLRMLSVVYDLSLNEAGYLSRESVESDLLEVFIRDFLNEAEILVRHGLAKGYRRIRERRQSASGKIIADASLESLVHKESMLCEFDVYDRATPHNRLIAAALAALRHLPISASLVERTQRISESYPDPCAPAQVASLLRSLVLDRRTAGYVRAMEYARLILLHFSPAQIPGERESLALLFKMNDLFESYVGKLVHHAARLRGWKVYLQNSKRFWERQTIRPDIIIETPQSKLILDTKWKVLKTPVPSVEDVRQMYAYNRFFHADRAMLVYPQVYNLSNRTGVYHAPDHELSCGLLFVSLFEDEVLTPALGEKILNYVEATTRTPTTKIQTRASGTSTNTRMNPLPTDTSITRASTTGTSTDNMLNLLWCAANSLRHS